MRPDDTGAHALRGSALCQLGDFERARAGYDEALRHVAPTAELFWGRGAARAELADQFGGGAQAGAKGGNDLASAEAEAAAALAARRQADERLRQARAGLRRAKMRARAKGR